MAKFHINPETGEPGRCSAKIRCRFGEPEEHYGSAEEARAAYEANQTAAEAPKSATKSSLKKASYTTQALSAPLQKLPQPAWTQALSEDLVKTFGSGSVEVIDVIDSPQGKLAVTWETGSSARNDKSIQLERGWSMPVVRLRSLETGEANSYVKLAYIEDSGLKKSFGEDEWQTFAWAEDTQGGSFGLDDLEKDSNDEYVKDKNGRYVKYSPIERATTAEERLAAKQRIWAKSYASLTGELHSKHFYELPEESRRGAWGGPEERHAPQDEKNLDKELAKVRKHLTKMMEDFRDDHADPTIDFSRIDEGLRGTGIGSALYVYAARMLARRGLRLRSSGIQSDEAQAVWARFAANPQLPVTADVKRWSRGSTNDVYYMDFR